MVTPLLKAAFYEPRIVVVTPLSHAQPYVRVAHTRIVVVTPLLKSAFYEPRSVVVTPLPMSEPCTAIRSRCSYTYCRSHLCLKPPSMTMHSHTFALLIPVGFTQRCDHGINAVFVYHCRFRIQYNTHTYTYTPTHTFPLFCISETTGPIEPKFCMHMECDQTIKSHKNIKLIWGHLGYANEGQWRHNVLRSIEVKSHLPVIGFLPNFDML